MASLKTVIKNDFVKESGKSTLYIRISHDGKTRYIKTPHEIEAKYLNPNGSISGKYPGQNKLNIVLNSILNNYNAVLADIGADIVLMDINSVVSRLKNDNGSGADFIKYAEDLIKALNEEKRYGYAESYRSTISLLKRHINKNRLSFKEISPQFLKGFETFLLNGRMINTVKVYMVNIRAIFNHAIDNDIVKIELFPFRKFKVKSERPEKRSLEVLQIQKLMIKPYQRAQQRSIDIFMLIFYLIGINIKDLLYLKPSDLKKGRITYHRFKTGGKFDVKVPPQAQEIIDTYRGEKYLLSFLDEDDSFSKYKNMTKETNKRLRMAGKHAGVEEPITTYWARHSFATIARKLGIPFDDIKQALGHDQGKVTDGYINYEMLRTRVDEAQERVIESLIR